MELDINWEERTVSAEEQKKLTELLWTGIEQALKCANGPEDAEMGLLLTDDAAIHEMNRTYRGVDAPTDVLSFAMQEKGEGEPDVFYDSLSGVADDGSEDFSVEDLIDKEYLSDGEEADDGEGLFSDDEEDVFYKDMTLGDIVISVERARAQAEEYRHSLDREIVYLAVHGTLHLLGFDHNNVEDTSIMRRLEEEVMENLGLTR
ncbi:rRNA maturation RNase YbeY [Dehalobacter sp. DCM]|uniref:rRNA maturation RNase YbeY n=1 Tax=Dehalobacter sp. DCM TaxID=2907827 RepID=UPI003081FE4C|nr:rRNA maturation RNase YbeY [Dehalobacter sp. DCM]